MSGDSIAIAPSGQKKVARGKKRSEAAPGHVPQNTSSRERAKEDEEETAPKERTIGRLVKPRAEKATPSAHPDLPYIGLEHIEAHSSKLLGSVPASEMKSTAKRFYTGDVLYSRLRPYLNKVWHADRDGLCSSKFIVMPGNADLDANFLRYRLNSSDFVGFANGLNAGDRPRVDFDQISSFILPAFSLAAQRAAVAEIEKQFTRLEAGVAGLRRVQANLKRYRAAVLKAACEGRLVPTEAELANAENRNFEAGEELLERIGDAASLKPKARRAGHLWGAGHVPDLTEDERCGLPVGWAWTKVRNVGFDPESAVQVGPMSMKSSDFSENGVPVLNVGCVQSDRFVDSKLDHLPPDKASQFERYRIKPGDVLFT